MNVCDKKGGRNGQERRERGEGRETVGECLCDKKGGRNW